MISPRHFLDVTDLRDVDIHAVLDAAEQPARPPVLEGRGVALIFEKPSLRTRNSCEMAIAQLGGHPVAIRPEEIGAGERETDEDITRVLERYYAVIAARVFAHSRLTRMAAVASVPVVNLLSDRSHPCQALADALTMRQHFGRLTGLQVAYVGDYNNVARSLGHLAAECEMKLHVACPPEYAPLSDDHADLVTADPYEAVKDADVVYTDVWTSMGQEDEASRRRAAFEGFTVDTALMGAADDDAIFLHCLPAHRGEEVAAEVVDGPQSRVFDQAENRLHAFRGLLQFLVAIEDA